MGVGHYTLLEPECFPFVCVRERTVPGNRACDKRYRQHGRKKSDDFIFLFGGDFA